MRDPRFSASRGRAQSTPPSCEEIEQARHVARELALGSPDAKRIEIAHERLNHRHEAIWDSFYEEFAALVRSDEERRRLWVAVLLDEVNHLIVNPEALLLSRMMDGDVLTAQMREWDEEINAFVVWDFRRKSRVVYQQHPLFFHLRLLLLVNPVAWCKMVDSLPSPDAMEAAFQYYTQLEQDRGLIEDLLSIAPPIFDATGGWLPSRSVIALLVTDKIIAHAQALHQAVSSRMRSSSRTEHVTTNDELRTLELQELPGWIRSAFRILLARPDGIPISIGLLGRLARNELLGNRGATWSAERQASRILAEALASAGLTIGGVYEEWVVAETIARKKYAREQARSLIPRRGTRKIAEDKGEGGRTLCGEGLPLALGAAFILGIDPKSQSEIEAFWTWFMELLVGQDPGLSLIQHGSSIVDVPQRFGFLLSRLPDPTTLFCQSYIKLEPQRRRTLFAHKYEHLEHDLGSMVLLRLGLFAAANWSERQRAAGDTGLAQELFWWIYEATRRLWLTSPHSGKREKKELVCLCFAFMPAIFGDALEDALSRAVPPIANDAWMITAAGSLLWKNGVASDRLAPLLRGAGADVELALRDAYQWAKITEDNSMPRSMEWQNPEFPSGFEELAGALNLRLEEERPADPPPETERTRLRNEFSRNVPWGAALLHCLDEDGCSPVLLLPLDAPGTTWLIQASLPPALRERFGLSPEVRILVIHGQVRGRDLRAALQEPTGATNVDPDLLVIAGDQPELAEKLPKLSGPWGQRVPWIPTDNHFTPLADALREHLPSFDLFEYRDPVRGSALVGRRAEIDDLTARLLRGEAVGVVGLRKVGKSSLLRAVAEIIDPIGARRGMFESLSVPLPEADPEALVVSLDVQGVAGRNLSVLLERLCTRLEERLMLAGIKCAPASRPGELSLGTTPAITTVDPMETFSDLLKLALERSSLSICFILDEYDLLFEGYGGEPGIPGAERLLAFLRAEAHATHRVSLALIGRDPVFLDQPLLEGFTNPLAGWARPMFLGPLRRDEADELLLRLGKRVSLDVGPKTRDTAWQWTGGHPLLLRQYGAALYELAHDPPSRPRPVPTDPIHEDAVELFLKRDAVYTICTEVHALLDARFPGALALAEELAEAPEPEASLIVSRHGGARSRALQLLSRFGIVAEGDAAPWIPWVYRESLAPFYLGDHSAERSAFGED
jgi:hypothetical protein